MSTHIIYGAEARPYIKPQKMKGKEEFFQDLLVLEGLAFDEESTYKYNTFLHEWVQMLFNSIHLFEAGYYDCAYYSLRQAVELAILAFYFVDLPERESNEKQKDWETLCHFPMLRGMLNELKEKGKNYPEFIKKLHPFLADLYDLQQVINKVIHKQGFFCLYAIQNHPILIMQKEQKEMINNFPKYLQRTISLLTKIRLMIDPFPLILKEKGIYFPMVITDSMPDYFVSKYLGEDFVSVYKNTSLFQSYYQRYCK